MTPFWKLVAMKLKAKDLLLSIAAIF